MKIGTNFLVNGEKATLLFRDKTRGYLQKHGNTGEIVVLEKDLKNAKETGKNSVDNYKYKVYYKGELVQLANIPNDISHYSVDEYGIEDLEIKGYLEDLLELSLVTEDNRVRQLLEKQLSDMDMNC